jgi:hypothetical protein
MWKQRSVTLWGCVAALPLLMGCANSVGGAPQAYEPPPPAAATVADTGGARIYAIGPAMPAAILVMLPGSGDMMTADPRLWTAQDFDVVTPSSAEIDRIAANQEAVMTRLIARARAVADTPLWLVGANPAIEAAISGAPVAGPGQVSGVVVTSMTSGAGTCSERMIYSYSGNGTPKVSVSKSGDACPAGSPFGAGGAGSTLAPPAPSVRPNAPRVIEASAANRSGTPIMPQSDVKQIADLIKSGPSS